MVRLAVIAACALLVFAACAEDFDPEELPREEIGLPDGSKAYIVRHRNTNWMDSTAEVLLLQRVPHMESHCFDAKFASFESNTLKLFRNDGVVKVFDDSLVKRIKELRQGDNIWLCGRLRAKRAGAGVELLLLDIKKLPEDFQLFESRMNACVKRKDAQALMELGNGIGKILADRLVSFEDHDKFVSLQRKAWQEALNLRMQKALDDKDADVLFDVAEKHLELLHKRREREAIIKKILREVDPNHRRSTEVASGELGMSLLDGVWVTKDEREAVLAQRREQMARASEEERKKLEAVRREREEAVRKRAEHLARHQADLRAAADDMGRLTKALEELGGAVKESPDAVFGRRAVEVLSNYPDPAAVYPGLDLASRSEFSEVRRDVYEALAWRGGENALKTLSNALKKETDASTLQAGVQALVRRSDRSALEALIDALGSESRTVQMEAIEGLKSLARLNLSDKEGWMRWWEANKDRKDLLPKGAAAP